MSLKRQSFVCLLILILSVSVNAQVSEFKATFIKAQQENKQVTVTLNSGNTYVGTVVSVNEKSAGVETADGLFNFRYDRIKNVKLYDPNDKTSGWRDNPAKNKLFITQTGKMLDKSSGYYQNTYIFFSNFSYGITNNISISTGFSMIPGLGIENQMFTAGAKVGTSLNSTLYVSGNIKYYKFFDFDEGVTSLFGSITYSKSRLDLTAATGIGLADGSSSDALLILGGQYRASERFAFISENIFFPTGDNESTALISLGGRIISSKSAFDLGFFGIEETLVPFVSYTLKF
ncbi:MAG: hypothetical protein ROO71_10680 [Balneola sp.]